MRKKLKNKLFKKLSARKRRILKQKALIYSTVSLFVMLLSFLYWLSFLPGITINNIDIQAAALQYNKELKKEINKYVYDSIFAGWTEYYPKLNYFLFDAKKLKQNLEFIFPKAHSLEVKKEDFHKLIVKYKERIPKYFLCLTDKHCYLIDKTGFFFETLSKADIPNKNLIEISDAELENTKLLRYQLPETKLKIIETVKENIDEDIRKIEFLAEQQFNVYTSKHFIKFIANENLNKEFETYNFVKDNILQDKQIEYIDLRFVPKVYYKEYEKEDKE